MINTDGHAAYPSKGSPMSVSEILAGLTSNGYKVCLSGAKEETLCAHLSFERCEAGRSR